MLNVNQNNNTRTIQEAGIEQRTLSLPVALYPTMVVL
jgi:hypothetical protein